ncbi:hypothetical protein GSY74_04975 [Sulfurovum sp. bin170]|uniref:hypothetical protein n=1 Tax=Sulfurovum sp. bin170 TaxID=2695268 RepID=UPI0013DF0C70|nr:hypothetical protein [Sulfurovum sp. bin170]NEW60629.1 hypothetical protein [Sulfurovum sp. bin170]
MDRGLLVFIAIGIVAIYLTTTFVDTIQDDERYQKSGYSENTQDNDEQYQAINSIGDVVLDVSSVDAKTQIKVWNRSEMKNEFLTNFPNFVDMRDFIGDKIVGNALQQRLRETIDTIEERFVAGEIGADEAKRKFTL